MFPTFGCLVNMVRLKQLLWNRYGFFFDVDTIQEVYPENELAEWVINVIKMHEMATPVYRDDAMSYEVRNEFFCDPQPTRIRPYCEEVAVQHRRQLFREKYIEYDGSGVH